MRCFAALLLQIHHNYEDMNSEGFLYLGFATLKAAERAIEAVRTNTLGQESDSGSSFYECMQARMALRRGGAPVFVADDDTAGLLLGRRQANVSNPFSQRSYGGDDDDDLMLQSLSQSVAFGGSSQATKKKKKKKSKKDTKTKKKTKRPRANSFLSPANE